MHKLRLFPNLDQESVIRDDYQSDRFAIDCRKHTPAIPAQIYNHQYILSMRNALNFNPAPAISPPWGNQASPTSPLQHGRGTDKQLSCDVVFGSPSADCMGTGVCRISARSGQQASESVRKGNCQSTVGLLFTTHGGNGVSMLLTKALICTQMYRKHLRHGTLTLESACPLPAAVVKTLGLQFRSLPTGRYPIHETDTFIRIDF